MSSSDGKTNTTWSMLSLTSKQPTQQYITIESPNSSSVPSLVFNGNGVVSTKTEEDLKSSNQSSSKHLQKHLECLCNVHNRPSSTYSNYSSAFYNGEEALDRPYFNVFDGNHQYSNEINLNLNLNKSHDYTDNNFKNENQNKHGHERETNHGISYLAINKLQRDAKLHSQSSMSSLRNFFMDSSELKPGDDERSYFAHYMCDGCFRCLGNDMMTYDGTESNVDDSNDRSAIDVKSPTIAYVDSPAQSPDPLSKPKRKKSGSHFSIGYNNNKKTYHEGDQDQEFADFGLDTEYENKNDSLKLTNNLNKLCNEELYQKRYNSKHPLIKVSLDSEIQEAAKRIRENGRHVINDMDSKGLMALNPSRSYDGDYMAEFELDAYPEDENVNKSPTCAVFEPRAYKKTDKDIRKNLINSWSKNPIDSSTNSLQYDEDNYWDMF